MHILSHRGYWKNKEEQNQEIAFQRSLQCGFGIETDVRDNNNNQLIISHDIPNGLEMTFQNFCHMMKNQKLPLAINIKSNGLAPMIKKIMEKITAIDWFVFDMSIPDMRSYLKLELPFFTRMSEIEKDPICLDFASGVWLDSFFDIWYTSSQIQELLEKGKRVCVVSPELHGREHKFLWEMIFPISKHVRLMLCTDYPKMAKEFFEIT